MLSLPVTASELLAMSNLPRHTLLPRGMLVESEVRFLYFLMRDVYEGSGAVVDAGAFCGASAYALAAGLADNVRIMRKSKRIFSYDLFRCDEPYTQDYVQNVFYSRFNELGGKLEHTFPVIPGQSFREVYDFQTCRYADLLEVNEGSFLDKTWTGQPIEVLFIDVAKTLELQSHLFREMLPSLIPGRSILIQQDFHHAWHPYIHVAMQFLAPYLETILSSAGATRAYRLDRPIKPEDFERVCTYRFTPDEEAALLRRTVDEAPELEKPLMRVTLARLLYVAGAPDACRRVMEESYAAHTDSWRAFFDQHFALTCPGVLVGG